MRLLLAARLSKVGDGSQTGIESQTAEVEQWAKSNGHEIIHVAADRKSGTVPPWERPHLRPWVTEPAKIALYDGVIAYRFDRLSRGDKKSTNAIESWAHQHGKMLLTQDGLVFPAEGTDGIRWDVTARIAHDEWLKASERYTRMQGYLRGEGKLVGRPPFGYKPAPAEDGRHKTLKPTETGKKYVPEIFARVIAGDSLATIAGWLNSEGVRPAGSALWWPKSIANVIRCRTYTGNREDGNGKTILRCEPLVDADVFRRAGEALKSLLKRGRLSLDNRAMLAGGVLFCPACDNDSPMYRIIVGRAPYRMAYYRCAGRGAQRRSCGLMVQTSMVDDAVNKIISVTFRFLQVTITRVIPGHDHAAEIEQVRYEIRQLAAQDLPDDEHDAELARLRAERDRLAALPAVPAEQVEEETEDTWAALWDALSTPERGLWLKRHGFRVTAGKDAVRLTQGSPGTKSYRTASVTL